MAPGRSPANPFRTPNKQRRQRPPITTLPVALLSNMRSMVRSGGDGAQPSATALREQEAKHFSRWSAVADDDTAPGSRYRRIRRRHRPHRRRRLEGAVARVRISGGQRANFHRRRRGVLTRERTTLAGHAGSRVLRIDEWLAGCRQATGTDGREQVVGCVAWRSEHQERHSC